MKKELFEELNNTCIEVKSAIHGFKVIEFWKSTGVIETENFSGQSIGAYYGLFDGIFTAKKNIMNERILTINEAIIIRDKYILNKDETIEQLQTRIKELEEKKTIENYVFVPIEINYWKNKSTHIYRNSFRTIEECQVFFDNIHKKDSGERWGTMLCDYRTAKWKTQDNGDLLMQVNHDGAVVEYICMKLVVLKQHL